MTRLTISRRDFIAAGAAAAALPLFARLVRGAPADRRNPDGGRPSFLIVLFDTLSAENISLHGYRRRTMPNLERFAAQATVFHNHTAAGNFTSPSTASLLTGVYPWAHRAVHVAGSVVDGYLNRNLFSLLRESHSTTVYTHNQLVEVFFWQMRRHLTYWKPSAELLLRSNLLAGGLQRDRNTALWAEDIVRGSFHSPHSSVFLSDLLDSRERHQQEALAGAWAEAYPRGLPAATPCWRRETCNDRYIFRLEDALEWVLAELETTARPHLTYVHVLPPHAPYAPRREFIGVFEDGWAPAPKPTHFFNTGVSEEVHRETRRQYDEYIANVDAAFGDLLDRLTSAGLLKDTYLIVTSDHGEMHERGVWQHTSETLFQPLVHIPLLIAAPGQAERKDVTQPTSTVDLLPTLASLAGVPLYEGVQGRVLPGLSGGDSEEERPVFSLDAKRSSKWIPLQKATVAVRLGRYKLCRYLGYEGFEDVAELYDLENDPEEREDLASARTGLAADLEDILRVHLRGQLDVEGWD